MATPFAVIGNRIAQIVFNCLFSIGIIVGNLVLIGFILSHKELRQNSKYILILLLAIADLYTGVFTIPMATHLMVTQTFDLSCLTQKVLQGSGYIHIAISCLGIVSIGLDYIFQNTMTSYKGLIRKLITFILAIFFIVGPLIVLVPIFVNGVSPEFAPNCILSLEIGYARAADILSYWAPVSCIVFTTIFAIVIYQRKRRRLAYQQFPGAPPQPPPQELPGNNASNPADIIVTASLTVVLFFPSEVVTLAGFSCGLGNCDWYFLLIVALNYIAEAKALLLPFMWFINKEFRNVIRHRSYMNESPPPYSQGAVYYTQQQQQYLSNPIAHHQSYDRAMEITDNEKQ